MSDRAQRSPGFEGGARICPERARQAASQNFVSGFLIAALLSAAILLASCSRETRETWTQQELVLGEPAAYALPAGAFFQMLDARGSSLLAFQRNLDPTMSVLESWDDGKTWKSVKSLPNVSAYDFHPSCGEVHWALYSDGRLWHGRTGPDSGVSAIEEQITMSPSAVALRTVEDGRIGVSWVDRTSGWPQLMFSFSADDGVSWSVPARINSESRGTDVFGPQLLYQANSWYVVWPENRNPQTLFDLYLSRSSDGYNWEPSGRLNDDSEYAWNWNPSLAGDGSRLFVLFSDYRRRNRFDDLDEDVYFVALDSLGSPLTRNIRLNDGTDAMQTYPKLAFDSHSGLLAAVWSDQRHHLTSDIFSSVSSDGGRTWSGNQQLNQNPQPRFSGPPLITVDGRGHFYLGWLESAGEGTTFYLRKSDGTRPAGQPASVAFRANPPAPEGGEPDVAGPRNPGKLLAAFNFDKGGLEGWKPVRGNWRVRNGALLGYGIGHTTIRWDGPPLADFVLDGKFRLDPLQHYSAFIFFRIEHMTGEGPEGGYQLTNHFRQGVFLYRSRGAFAGKLNRLQPVGDVWLPFQRNRWYTFRLHVDGRRLDYSIDGKRVFSLPDLQEGPAGPILLGTNGFPTEFDDLRIYGFAQK